MDQRWQIELFGWLRVVQGDRIVSRFRTRKAEALLAYLAYFRERSHPREQLIELLWPEGDPSRGAAALAQSSPLCAANWSHPASRLARSCSPPVPPSS